MASISENLTIIKGEVNTMKDKLSLPVSATIYEVTEKTGDIDPNLQDKTVSPSDSEPVVITADELYDGLGTVTVRPITSSMISSLTSNKIKKGEEVLDMVGTYGPTNQIKTVIPTTEKQIIRPDGDVEFLSEVNVEAVTPSIDPNISGPNIKVGVNILGVTGTFEGEFDFQEKRMSASPEEDVEVVADGRYDALSKVIINKVTSSIDYNIKPDNIKNGVKILGVQGTYAPAPSMIEKTVSPKTYDQTVYPDEGYASMDKVKVTAVTSSIDGSIKASNIREGVEILKVKGTLEPVKGESITVHPSVNAQGFTPSEGYNAITTVTVAPVTHEIDSKIIPENIKEGVSVLGVEGTFNGGLSTLQTKQVIPSDLAQEITADSGYDALSTVTVVPTPTEDITVSPSVEHKTYQRSDGKFINSVTVNKVTSDIDLNIQPENIKENMSILGVVGTYSGEKQEYFSAVPGGSTKPNESSKEIYHYTDLSSYHPLLKSIIALPDTLTLSDSTNASNLFADMSGLTRIPTVDFSNVVYANYLFKGCSKVVSYPVFNFPKLTEAQGMFCDANVSSCYDNPIVFENKVNFFRGCYSVNGLRANDVFKVRFKKGVTNLNYAMAQNYPPQRTGTLQLDSDVECTPTMYYGFESSQPLNIIISPNIKPTDTRYAFRNVCCGNKYDSGGIIEINLSKATSVSYTFYGAMASEIHILGGEDVPDDQHVLTTIGTYFLYAFRGIRVTGTIPCGKVTSIESSALSPSNSTGSSSGVQCCVQMPILKHLGKAYTRTTQYYSYYTVYLNSNLNNLEISNLYDIIDNLWDINISYNVANGGTLYRQKVVVTSSVYNQISQEYLDKASAKGWTIATS